MTTADLRDFVLRWPLETFRTETARLLNSPVKGGNWEIEVSTILADAFTTGGAASRFESLQREAGDPFGRQIEGGGTFLLELLRGANQLPAPGRKRPYYSQRKAGVSDRHLPLDAAVTEFVRVVNDLADRGYFDGTFGVDCVDDRRDTEPGRMIAVEIGKQPPWPLYAKPLIDDQDLFLDLVEVLHDFAACPKGRDWHDWNECGWHYSNHSPALGQQVYRWSVNAILERTDLKLVLADDGEDIGRLVGSTDEARADLAAEMAQREDAATGDEVRHALALFRARGATDLDKRSACIALAGVLEQRRVLLREDLLRRDEGALFRIANEFAIRHQTEQQKGDYDPIFLDWVFWNYLATIELTDRLLVRRAPPA